ncbi:hypothetical protein Aab01nite_44050 [Paractinoplanes abujensis]|uniref:Uncharacterized protein n=1 Tax=Paractinoplanes abujensis TaxID=882441 RepID=A0A7W7CK43_9ACTN|nr:hypothetical protein [Actinoplanes abujensis]MBB4690042.1 hypothetical protein [Actinoplanes abujensis]GID20815.1 hypothetical protein Aab01nite_44050 [Actinoplanes abujensis]
MSEETGVWRDENKLPLSELKQAMATNSQDGQVDDLTGEDAGAASAPGSDRVLPPSPDGTTADGRSGPN